MEKHSGVGYATYNYLIANFDNEDDLAKTECGRILLMTARGEAGATNRASKLGVTKKKISKK